MKRIVSCVLAAVCAAGLCACSVPGKAAPSVTSSAGLEKYASWLGEKVGDTANVFVGDADDAARYGIDMGCFLTEGYVIRCEGDEVVIFGADEVGVDRAVRDYAHHAGEVGYEATYNEGCRVKRMTLAGYDIGEYDIVIPEDADECVRFAAENLRDYTKKACGAELEIVTESSGRAIEFVPDPDGMLGDEGFIIRTGDGNAQIVCGRYRGALWGAMEFLEKYEGWRFVPLPDTSLPSGTGWVDYLYESEHVDIPAGIEDRQTPAITSRGSLGNGFGSSDSPNEYKIKYTGTSVRGNAKYGGYGIMDTACHGLQNWWDVPLVKYSEKGQPCYLLDDNIEMIADHVRLDARNALKAGKVIGRDLVAVDISQPDNISFCECKDCRKMFQKEGTHAASVITMANAVGEDIEKDYPELWLHVFAYYGTNTPPAKVRPGENVAVSYCFYISTDMYKTRICMSHPFDGSECELDRHKQFGRDFEKWCEISSRVDVWYYGEDYYPCFPTPDAGVILYENMRYLAKHGAYGVFYLDGEEYFGVMETYLAIRLMWDPDVSKEEFFGMMREYLMIVYGEKAGEDVYDYCVMWDRSGRTVGCSASLISPPTYKADAAYYADNYDKMVWLFEDAIENAETGYIEAQLAKLSLHMDLMGIESSWDGPDTAFVGERYKVLYDRARRYGFRLNSSGDNFPADGMDFTKRPSYYYMGENKKENGK